MASDDFVRSMMLGGNGPPQVKQELRVASPMNDLQLLGIMAAILYGKGGPILGTPQDEDRIRIADAVNMAVEILGEAAAAVRSGAVISAVRGQPEEQPQ